MEASTENIFTKRGLPPEAEHIFRVRAVCGNEVSEWSGIVKWKTPKMTFEASAWKECPDYIDGERKYFVDEENPRIAAKIVSWECCTIIGNTPLPLDKVTSWNVKILKSENIDGGEICIGVAPSDIDQNEDYNKYGWYFGCYDSTLCSGPPHNYSWKEYGPRKEEGEYVHTGDTVGVVMNTIKGELSFVLNSENLGVAYKGIPLDKPFVPCVILHCLYGAIELNTTEILKKCMKHENCTRH